MAMRSLAPPWLVMTLDWVFSVFVSFVVPMFLPDETFKRLRNRSVELAGMDIFTR